MTRRIKDFNTVRQLNVDCRKLVPDVLPDYSEILTLLNQNKTLVLQATSEKVILVPYQQRGFHYWYGC